MLQIISLLIRLIMALIAIAFFTLLERKYLGYSQLRKGPNKVVFLGLPQPIADAIKLFLKEQNFPIFSNKLYFIYGPMLRLVLALFL